jgi:hypothetical protein
MYIIALPDTCNPAFQVTRISRPLACLLSLSPLLRTQEPWTPNRAAEPSRVPHPLLNTDTSSHFLLIHYLSPPELTCATLPRYNRDALIHGGGDDLVECVRDGRSCGGRHVARAAAGGKEVVGEGGFGIWYDKLVRSVSLHVCDGDSEGKRKSCEGAFACVPRPECNYPDNQRRASGYKWGRPLRYPHVKQTIK